MKKVIEMSSHGPSISAKIIEKLSSLTSTRMSSGGLSSRLFSSRANSLMTLGGRFSFVAYITPENKHCVEYSHAILNEHMVKSDQ